MTALETAIAKIEADAIARKAVTAAINADTRVAALLAIAKANDVEVTQHGEAGFAELMAHFMSARAIRRQRAKTLYLARRAKLFNRCSAFKALRLAADLRKQERATPVASNEAAA
jgi:hypothetical protein